MGIELNAQKQLTCKVAATDQILFAMTKLDRFVQIVFAQLGQPESQDVQENVPAVLHRFFHARQVHAVHVKHVRILVHRVLLLEQK